MEFNYIVNPETGRKVSIYGKTGQRVLNNYFQAGGGIRSGSRIPPSQYCHNGGGIRSGSRIPPSQYCQKGGNKCKKYRKTKDPKCKEQAGCKWVVRQGCLEDYSPASSSLLKLKTPTKAKKSSPKKSSLQKLKKPTKAKKSSPKKSSLQKLKKPIKAKKTDCEMMKKDSKGKQRISARCYYDTYGANSIGDKCSPARAGGEGCLRLTKKGSPRWSKCNSGKTVDAQTPCQYRQ